MVTGGLVRRLIGGGGGGGCTPSIIVVSGSLTTAGTIQLACSPIPFGTYTYQWFKSTDNGANYYPISGATSQSLTLTDATADDNGRYVCDYTTGGITNSTGSKTVAIAYDYYVNSLTGDDGNDGTSTEEAWQTLSAITTSKIVDGETKTVFVAAGDYDTADDYVLLATGATSLTDSTLSITFAPGCVMDGTNQPGNRNGVEQSGDSDWHLVIRGNGLTIQNYQVDGSGSPNGLGNRDSTTLTAYDVNCDANEDNFSCHDSANMNLYRCTGINGTKGEFNHVANCTVYAEDCEFIFSNSTINGAFESGVTIEMNRCKILSAGDVERTWIGNNTTFNSCQIGSFTGRVEIVGDAGSCEINDSFVNVRMQGNVTVALVECYGSIAVRMRNGGSITATRCVFDSEGLWDAMLFSDYNPGSMGTFAVIDCVINNYDETAIGWFFNETYAGYFEDSGNTVTYCNFFGNGTNIDADILATSADVSTGNITTDPLLNDPAGSYLKSDWGYLTGSPCIGAGSTGGNIGFAAAS